MNTGFDYIMKVHLSISLKKSVRLLVKNNDDVSRFKSWFLISLPREGDLLPVLHALVNGHLQDLPLAVHFSPIALLTPGRIHIGDVFLANSPRYCCELLVELLRST